MPPAIGVTARRVDETPLKHGLAESAKAHLASSRSGLKVLQITSFALTEAEHDEYGETPRPSTETSPVAWWRAAPPTEHAVVEPQAHPLVA
jgi:hypothetical protein